MRQYGLECCYREHHAKKGIFVLGEQARNAPAQSHEWDCLVDAGEVAETAKDMEGEQRQE